MATPGPGAVVSPNLCVLVLEGCQGRVQAKPKELANQELAILATEVPSSPGMGRGSYGSCATQYLGYPGEDRGADRGAQLIVCHGTPGPPRVGT